MVKSFKAAKPAKAYRVHSLERGLDIVELLANGPREMSLSELARQAEFSLSTTHRILDSLKARGYARQNTANKKYRATFRLFELGSAIMRKMTVYEEALPAMRELSANTGECSFLNIVDNDECLCLAKVEGHQAMQVVFLQPGGRIPLHVAAGPKVLLANLPDEEIERILTHSKRQAMTGNTVLNPGVLWRHIKQIRKSGYAVSLGEKTGGAKSIAFPILTANGTLVAGISITGFAQHFTRSKMPELVEAVRKAAHDIGHCLGIHGPPL